MYLKSLEIQGFKSFPDKTLLQFSDGITAIVGPNGSGKSNIVDAIRWVLGEQSTKTLRGGKMEDVIFGGTAKRTSQGFCQVSLTLDNQDREIDSDFSEIMVTRRYYRSGESEFFINRKSVRLKDIHEMFMDTGLGRDGYSIIGQGRIDEILSVKSADRREIFEEASGITKFRYRKEESEKRLAAAEENLVRIRDIITELEVQVEPLRVQSEKAKSFLLYRDELRVLEISVWMDTLAKLHENVAKAHTDFENAERGLSAKKRELEEIYEKSQLLTEEMHQKDVHGECVRDELREIENQQAAVRSSIAVNQTNLQNNEDNILAKVRELDAHGERTQSFAVQREEKQQRICQIEGQVAALQEEIAKLTQEVQQVAVQSGDLGERLNAITSKMQLEMQNVQEAQVRHAGILSQRAELDTRGHSLGGEIADMTARLQEQREKSQEIDRNIEENSDKKQGAENMLRGFELRLKSRENKASQLSDAVMGHTRELNAKRDRHAMLSAMERDFEGFSQSVRRVMSGAQRGELKGVHGPLSTLIKVPDEYAVAIEIALGAAMQNIVVDNEECGKNAITYLKMRDYGRATFLPLTAVKPRGSFNKNLSGQTGFCGMGPELVQCDSAYRDIILNQLGNTAVCDNMDNAIALAKKQGYSFRIVTLDGQLINQSGAMTGGSLNKNTGVLSRANELERLNADIEAMSDKQQELEQSLGDAKRELAAATYEMQVAQDELRLAQDALLSLEGQKSQHGMLLHTISGRISELQEESRSHGARIDENEKRALQALADIKTYEDLSQQWKNQRDELAGDIDQAQSLRGAVSEQIGELKNKKTGLLAQIEGHRASVAELSVMIEAQGSDSQQKSDEVSALRQRNESLREDIAAQEENCTEMEQIAEQKRQLLKSINSEKLNLEGQRSRTEKEGQSKNSEILNMERERSRLENRKTQLEMEESSILSKMWEGYELTRVTAADIARPVDSFTSPGKRIIELKSDIRKLGSVNVDAIDEYAKVSERYEFLSTQRKDLDKAKTELLGVISELTKNMESIFGEQFKLINETFGNTFAEIFGGGSAQLKLEDESDILNCGIEIRVELPGKSMRAISLLSGGEKAFVAIALYFSIIKVRPTPFCVLDEIEAALDDVNVLRYITYMHTLCGGTQFIVITHRRGTMEGSDILYGVTMQEQGVSKLLALNINEVEEKIKLRPN